MSLTGMPYRLPAICRRLQMKFPVCVNNSERQLFIERYLLFCDLSAASNTTVFDHYYVIAEGKLHLSQSKM